MPDRRVTQTGKDDDGDITSLCKPFEDWSPRTKKDAIDDIENKYHTYYVNEDGSRANIIVTADGHLKTEADSTTANNLDNLPDC
jgi:hypothetical protein